MGKKRASVCVTAKDTMPAQAVIVIEGNLDISRAGALRTQLLSALQENKAVLLDGANVERVDTAALQALTAFFKDAAARNLGVQWQGSSAALRNAARLLGLQEILHIN